MQTGCPQQIHSVARDPCAHVLTQAVLLACLALGAVVPCQAQSAGVQASAVRYDIPGGTLDQVLNRFAAMAGFLIAVDGALTAGRTSPGLSGSYGVNEGLAAILAGSGLEAVAQPGGAYALRRLRPAENQPAPGEALLPAVNVTARSAASPGALPEAYAGGQVARGARLGLLGNADAMDTPFNVTSYTAELIENQQAHSLADVTQNDPSVRSVFAQGSGIDQLYIRGFLSANQDTAFNGQFGIAPSASGMLAVEMYERVEVLKGASSFLYGVAPSGSTGGVINVVPKRAGEEPLTRVTVSAASDSVVGIHADVGRRFGPDQVFGIRVNALKREGEAAWQRNERETTLGSVAFDVNTERVRAALDLGYQEQRSETMPVSVRLGAGVAVPRPPRHGESYVQHWIFNDARNRFAALRGEFDLSSSVQAYASYGWNEVFNEVLNSYPTVSNAASGAMRETAPFHSNTHIERKSAEVGLRVRFATGQIGHVVTLGATDYRQETGLARETLAPIDSNLYAPRLVSRPALRQFSSRPDNTEESRFTSVALADTLSLFDERLQLMLGARSQKIEASSFSAMTGARTAHYDETAVTPFAAVVGKPLDGVSIYANYIEALSQGPVAPLGAVNVGEVFSPIKSKQYEMGVKVDVGRHAVTASVFQIKRPSAATDPDSGRYGLIGEQRNRGVELGVSGEPVEGIRVLGGAAYVEGKLSKTAGGINDGRTAPGVPRLQLNLGGEWDLAALPGLTLSARAVHTSSQYYDQENVRSIPRWTRFDLGGRYTTGGTHPLTLRLSIENVANKRYWASSVGTFGSELNAGAPRIVQLSASMSF